jgi:alkylation response protein AidB-like acyl-CoA dehydrogenase
MERGEYYLSSEIRRQLREEAPHAEKQGSLTAKQLELIYANKLFNLFVPKKLGGLELDLIRGLEIEEEIARIDGSLGWTITLCSGANAFAGFLQPEWAEKIFSDPKVCLAGSGKLGGIARETERGYVISGRWNYVTGLPHATIFTANCRIEKNGELQVCDDGSPRYQSFFFTPDEVVFEEDWHTMGLVATASHSFKVENRTVDAGRSFVIDGAFRTIDHLMYQYPYLPFAALTLGANHLGILEHFLELAETIFASIQEPLYRDFRSRLLERAAREAEKLRVLFFHYARLSWDELKKNGVIAETLLEKISALCREIVKKGRDTVMEVYPYLGIAASNPETEVNRLIRDVLTASQHRLLL